METTKTFLGPVILGTLGKQAPVEKRPCYTDTEVWNVLHIRFVEPNLKLQHPPQAFELFKMGLFYHSAAFECWMSMIKKGRALKHMKKTYITVQSWIRILGPEYHAGPVSLKGSS